MKAKWLVEHFDDRNSTHLLIEEVKCQGFECKTIEYLPFMSGSIDVFEDVDCVVTQTSINLALQISSQKKGWIPGPWLTEEKYRCSKYYPHIGDLLFNDCYVMMPRSEVLRNKKRLYNWLGLSNSVFMRPDSGLKSFTGKVIREEDFEKEWSWVEEFTDPESLIVISTPKTIKFEWRFIVADKNVITGSQYNVAGEHSCSPIYPDKAYELAKEIAIVYQPDTMFVIDICQGSDEEYYLLEIGAFSCAGLYDCNMATIVEHASYLAEREWEDLNSNY